MKCSLSVKILVPVVIFVGLGVALVVSWDTIFPQNLKKVRIGATKHAITNSLLFIGMEQGHFEEEGIEIIFEPIGSPEAFDQVIANEMDMAVSSETPAVFRSFEHDNFFILASIYSAYNDPKIVALRSSDISTPYDLAGKNIGTTRQGESAHYFSYLFLTKYDLFKEDIQISHHKARALTDSFASGKFDAVALFEPFVTKAALSVGNDALVFSEPKLYFKRGLIVANSKFVVENPDTVQGVLRGLKRAEEFVIQNPDQAIQIMADRISVDVSDIHKSWSESYLEVNLDQVLLLTLENEAKWAIENQFTSANKVPNFLELIYFEGLEVVDPHAVTMIH